MSWLELDGDGREIEFHELEETEVQSWDEVRDRLMDIASGKNVAFSCVFVKLDTIIDELSGRVWKPRSAELQLSIDAPEMRPEKVAVGYSVFIDAWLTMTYGEHYEPRDNQLIALANQPGLAAVLRSLRETVGDSFQVGQSQLYPFAIYESGFRETRALPERRR